MNTIATEFEITGSILILSSNEKNILLKKDNQTGLYFLPRVQIEPGVGLEERIGQYLENECGLNIKGLSFLGVIENLFEQRDVIRHEYLFIFKPLNYCEVPETALVEHNFEWHALPLPSGLNFEPDFLKEDLYRWLKGEEISFSSNKKQYYG